MPSTRHTPVKTRTPWPPGTRCRIVYIINDTQSWQAARWLLASMACKRSLHCKRWLPREFSLQLRTNSDARLSQTRTRAGAEAKLVSCYASYVKIPKDPKEPSAGLPLRARALSETARRPSAESKVPAGSVATGALRRLSNRRVAANAARTPPPRRRTHARVVGRTPCAVAAPLPCGQPASAPSHQQATK